MAFSSRYCPSCLLSLPTRIITPFAFRANLASPFLQQARTAAQSSNANKSRSKKDSSKGSTKTTKKKRKTRSHFLQPDLRRVTQFSLVDAMRYLRAAEVGRPPNSAKYDLHIRLRTAKNGAVVRNRLLLPHPVHTDLRIAVICPSDSAHARAAKAAGAHLVGEEEIFDAVKAGRIEFERCICQQDSLAKLGKSGVARILGPRGLMPSAKLGTVVKDVGSAVRGLAGGSEYRERMGVVRMAIGQLGFTPEEMQSNIRVFIEGLKKDIGVLSDRISKDIHEVVLSSTHGPGLSLNGELRGPASPPTKDLSTM